MIKLLTPEQVADALGGIPVKTLYKWRHDNKGPQSIRVGKYLRYRPADVEAWVDAQAPDTNVTPLRRRSA